MREKEREMVRERSAASLDPPTNPRQTALSLLRAYLYAVACSSASNAGGSGGSDTHKFVSITSHPALRRKTELFANVKSMAGHDWVTIGRMLCVSPVSGGKWKVARPGLHVKKNTY